MHHPLVIVVALVVNPCNEKSGKSFETNKLWGWRKNRIIKFVGTVQVVTTNSRLLTCGDMFW
jgi:hypothetical protein